MTGAETEAASATPLVMIRHGPTDWNERSLIQGRSDRALSASGRQAVARWRLPAELASYRWTSSPLRRALELGVAERSRVQEHDRGGVSCETEPIQVALARGSRVSRIAVVPLLQGVVVVERL